MHHPLAAVIVWAVFLLGAIPYVRHARHPDARPLAAYLIFVLVFSAVAAFLWFALAFAAGLAGGIAILETTWGAILFLLAVFAPAALVARWQLRKPPRQAPPIE